MPREALAMSSLPPGALCVAPVRSVWTLWGSLWQPHLQGPRGHQAKQGLVTGAGWGPSEALGAPNARTPISHQGGAHDSSAVPGHRDLTAASPPSPCLSPPAPGGEGALLTVS